MTAWKVLEAAAWFGLLAWVCAQQGRMAGLRGRIMRLRLGLAMLLERGQDQTIRLWAMDELEAARRPSAGLCAVVRAARLAWKRRAARQANEISR